MGRIVVLVLLATAAVCIASRNARSPGGSGWQTSIDSNGRSSSCSARSSHGGWASSGGSWASRGGLGRSASNIGWRSTAFGSSSQSQSRNGNRNPSSSGWLQSGYNSNGGYGEKSLRASLGWKDRFADSTVIESLDSSNSWNEPNQSFRSNNGWQSSSW